MPTRTTRPITSLVPANCCCQNAYPRTTSGVVRALSFADVKKRPNTGWEPRTDMNVCVTASELTCLASVPCPKLSVDSWYAVAPITDDDWLMSR